MFSKYLMDEGARVTVVEPSSKACEVAKQRGVAVINAYLDSNLSLEPNSFDAFVARQVLERIDKPYVFLQNIQHFLKPNAIGLMEVPYLLKTIEDRRYYDFCPEHLVYYSVNTLLGVLINSNFEVLDIFRDANDEYMVAFVKNSNLEVLINHFIDGFFLFKESLCKLVDNFSHHNKKIGVWGAGGKSITFLSFCELTPNKIEYVVDSDPNKWNRYTPGSKIKIVPPNYLLKHPVDVIIVGAVMYQAEIIKQLKSQLKFKGPIVVLAPRPHILSADEII